MKNLIKKFKDFLIHKLGAVTPEMLANLLKISHGIKDYSITDLTDEDGFILTIEYKDNQYVHFYFIKDIEHDTYSINNITLPYTDYLKEHLDSYRKNTDKLKYNIEKLESENSALEDELDVNQKAVDQYNKLKKDNEELITHINHVESKIHNLLPLTNKYKKELIDKSFRLASDGVIKPHEIENQAKKIYYFVTGKKWEEHGTL